MKKKRLLVLALGLSVIGLTGSCASIDDIVKPTVVTELSITNGATADIKVNETYKLNVIYSKTGKDDVVISYESLNNDVATVDENGVVTGLKIGATAIVVRTNFSPEIYDVISINVLTNEVIVPVEGIKVKDPGEVVVGKKGNLNVTILPESATNKELTYITLNKQVATIDAFGEYQALGAGETDFVVTSKDGGFTKVAHIKVVNETIALTGLTLIAPATVEINSTTTLDATLAPQNTTQKKIEYVLAEPSDLAVVANGKLYAKGTEGVIKLKVKSLENTKIESPIVEVKIVDSSLAVKKELESKFTTSFDLELAKLDTVKKLTVEEDYSYGSKDVSFEQLEYTVYTGPHYVANVKDYGYGSYTEKVNYKGLNENNTLFQEMELNKVDNTGTSYKENAVTAPTQDDINNGTLYALESYGPSKNGVVGYAEYKLQEALSTSKEGLKASYTKNGNYYKVKSSYLDGWWGPKDLIVNELSFEFNANGALINFVNDETKFEAGTFDETTHAINASAAPLKDEHTSLTATYTDARSTDYGSDINEDSFKITSIDNLYFTDSNNQVYTDTKISSGEKLKVNFDQVMPATTSTKLDEIKITSSDKAVADVSWNGADIEFKSAGTVTLTFESTYGKMTPITKTFEVSQPLPSSIEVYLGWSSWNPVKTMKVGEKQTVGVKVGPEAASQEYQLELTAGADCGTLEYDAYWDEYKFVATKAGNVTIKATSKVAPNVSGTYSFVVESSMTEADFDALVSGGRYELIQGGEKFVGTFDKATKKLEVLIYQKETNPTPDQTLSATYAFANEEVTFTNASLTGTGYYTLPRRNPLSFSVKDNQLTIVLNYNDSPSSYVLTFVKNI